MNNRSYKSSSSYPRIFAILCTILFLSGLSSCASSLTPIAQIDIETVRSPYFAGSNNPSDPSKPDGILAAANKRNSTIEDGPDWIKQSYDGLRIRKLSSIPEKEYEKYRQYLDGENVYIVIHPGYYPFFQYQKIPGIDPDGTSNPNHKMNAVERFLALPPKDMKFSVLQAQERALRDFIEYKSTEGKLIILVLPKNYTKYNGYTYKNGPDEYMRYLNEVTNFSKSVIYIESRSPVTGYMTEEDSLRTREFILAVGAKTVLLGGGYIGRCVEDFYVDFVEENGQDNVFVVPEISAVSPRELTGKVANSLMSPDGTINTANATKNLINMIYDSQDLRPKVMNLQ